jgi:hypothetical protein
LCKCSNLLAWVAHCLLVAVGMISRLCSLVFFFAWLTWGGLFIWFVFSRANICLHWPCLNGFHSFLPMSLFPSFCVFWIYSALISLAFMLLLCHLVLPFLCPSCKHIRSNVLFLHPQALRGDLRLLHTGPMMPSHNTSDSGAMCAPVNLYLKWQRLKSWTSAMFKGTNSWGKQPNEDWGPSGKLHMSVNAAALTSG